MEFKYADGEKLFEFVKDSVRRALLSEEMIQDVSLRTAKEERAITVEQQRRNTLNVPEPFEKEARTVRYRQALTDRQPERQEKVKSADEKAESDKTADKSKLADRDIRDMQEDSGKKDDLLSRNMKEDCGRQDNILSQNVPAADGSPDNAPLEETPVEVREQLSLPVEKFISEEARKRHRMVGQVFKTYWIIEYDEKMYIVDQHAAHEKVMFERLMRQMNEKQVISQQLLPPKVLHLDSVEYEIVMNKMELFQQTGFDLEDFGDDSIVVRAMPDDIMGVDPQALFDALLNALTEDVGKISRDFFVEKLSGMACKAAIKGNTEITLMEADKLIEEMLTLDNPYNCPHGRPTMIALTRTELERKFKRIQN